MSAASSELLDSPATNYPQPKMMWDLGSNVYVPGQSSPPPPIYPQQQNPYPAFASQEVTPFEPLGQPGPQMGPASYGDPYAYNTPYYAAQPPPQMSRGVSEPPNPFAGAAMSAGNEFMQHSYSTQPVQPRSLHQQHHSRPHRVSNAQQPVHHKLTHQASGVQPHVSSHQPHQHSQVWQYSKCTGRKKALCIGINYLGTPQELNGCINDARNVRNFLIRHCRYKAEDIVLLSDEASNPRQIPTRTNILDAMRWLVKDAHQHDSLFFHYSGHGSQVKDRDGDEKDGYDEVILPVDYRTRGYISDDLMHDVMVKPLPLGCRLTALFDSCHSGSVLDLPYLYHTDGRVKGSQVTSKWREAKSTPADVISWSGCKDSQTSADTWEAGVATGAMSYAFMHALRENPDQSYQELLRSVRKILHDKYSQKPQLSTSHRIDTTLKFIV